MISLESKAQIPYTPKISFMQTACLISAFSGSTLAPDLWVQRVNGRPSAVISRYGGRLNVTADGADFAEIKEFIRVIGFSEIFTEKNTAISLGFNSFSEFAVLKKTAQKTAEQGTQVSLSNLYGALKLGADGEITLPEFEAFAPDVSHRLRHGAATAVLTSFGGALAFTSEFGGIINGISVNKNSRGRGLGSELLSSICGTFDGEVFVCTNKKTAEFYIKNGFTPCGEAVIIRG